MLGASKNAWFIINIETKWIEERAIKMRNERQKNARNKRALSIRV